MSSETKRKSFIRCWCTKCLVWVREDVNRQMGNSSHCDPGFFSILNATPGWAGDS